MTLTPDKTDDMKDIYDTFVNYCVEKELEPNDVLTLTTYLQLEIYRKHLTKIRTPEEFAEGIKGAFLHCYDEAKKRKNNGKGH